MPRGRWVGIDEAGYGPNLGPLVMSYVSAVGELEQPPDLWGDLAATVCRAGDRSPRLWIDDSKLVYAGRRGRWRLAAATLAALRASGKGLPADLAGLHDLLGLEPLRESELARWLGPDEAPPLLPEVEVSSVERALEVSHFEPAAWRLETVRASILGPRGFNELLAVAESKAAVHASVFAGLLRAIWASCSDGVDTHVRCDKHGGRHFYVDLLRAILPDVRIESVEEGPSRSAYRLHGGAARVTIEFCPKADATCGLTALASITSKWLRESWMDPFNAFWQRLVPGLNPSAGYPPDATRFRTAIASVAESEGILTPLWWRER